MIERPNGKRWLAGPRVIDWVCVSGWERSFSKGGGSPAFLAKSLNVTRAI